MSETYFQRYYRENRERRKAESRAWHAANRKAILERKREYSASHRSEIHKYNRAYYEQHRDEAIARARVWAVAHPEKMRECRTNWNRSVIGLLSSRENQGRRRAQKNGAGCEKIDFAVVFQRDEGLCGICGESVDPADWHLDHIEPLVRGGSHTYANVQVAHPRCNLSKGCR